ncbi:MAG: nitroreductase [Chitinivibrionales bacterium]|nr:nitroreductase [Chitinivibrionales bacterium]
MSFLDIVKSRFSVRGYENKPVEDEKIGAVLEAGRLAPSACNIQPWHFVVIKNESTKHRMKRVYDREWFLSAPVIIAVCIETASAWCRMDRKSYGFVDAAIAMDHMVLAATEAGLGTCWIGAFDPQAAKEVLGLPEGMEPVVFTPLGYPAKEHKIRPRKELEEIVHYETF